MIAHWEAAAAVSLLLTVVAVVASGWNSMVAELLAQLVLGWPLATEGLDGWHGWGLSFSPPPSFPWYLLPPPHLSGYPKPVGCGVESPVKMSQSDLYWRFSFCNQLGMVASMLHQGLGDPGLNSHSARKLGAVIFLGLVWVLEGESLPNLYP